MGNGIHHRSMGDAKAVIPTKLVPELYEHRYFKQVFPGALPIGGGPLGHGDPTGATGDENILQFRGPMGPMDAGYHINGAGQTLLAPANDASAGYLLAGLDVVAAEGVEYLPGQMLSVHNPFAVKCGDVDYPASFVRLKAVIATVANVAECAVGWHKAEAYQANLDDYDELACLNILAGDLKQETIINGAGTVTTDTGTNVTDALTFTLESQVHGRRVRNLYNGVDVSAPLFDFDADEIVLPFIFFLQGGAGSAFGWYELEVGRLWLSGRDGSRR